MFSRWTQHLKDPKEKEDFEREIWSAKRVLERQKAIIDEDETALDRSEMNQHIYDLPNWENRQAHKNGNRQYMHTMRILIDLDQQKKETT